LAGDAFTAADISVVYALNMGGALGLADDYPASIADYWARMKTRPAYQAAIAK
jgi:glutathione S-transferase